jgi:hypothetical protein
MNLRRIRSLLACARHLGPARFVDAQIKPEDVARGLEARRAAGLTGKDDGHLGNRVAGAIGPTTH